MPQLKCIAAYSDGGKQFETGKTYHFKERPAALLLRGSPGSWRVVEGEVRVGGPDERVNYEEREREAAGVADARAAARLEDDRRDAEARAERERQAVEHAEEAANDAEREQVAAARAADAAALPAPLPEGEEEETEDEDMDLLAAMTVPQLREHARGLGIAVGHLRTRADFVAAIERSAADDDDTEDD